MKTCSRCQASKDASAFSKDSRRKDGLRSNCKACDSAIKKAYAEGNPDVLRERRAAYHKVWWRRKGKRVNTRKSKCRAIKQLAGTVPIDALAEKVGISPARVAFYATKMGISLACYRPRYDGKENARIIDMRKSGMTQQAIADALGRPLSGIRAKLRQLKEEGQL